MTDTSLNPKVQESIDFIKKLMKMSFHDRTMAFHEAATFEVLPNFDTLVDIPLYAEDGSIKRIVPVPFFLVNTIQDNVLSNKNAVWNQYLSVYGKQDSHGFSWQMYVANDTYKEVDKNNNVLDTCNHLPIEGSSIIFERKAIFDDVIKFFKDQDLVLETSESFGSKNEDKRRQIFPDIDIKYYNLDVTDFNNVWNPNESWENQKSLFLDQMRGISASAQEDVAKIIYPFVKKELKDFLRYEKETVFPPTDNKTLKKKKFQARRMTRLFPSLAERNFIEQLLLLSSRPVRSVKLADILFVVNIHNYLNISVEDQKAQQKRSVILYNLKNLSSTTSFYNKNSRVRRLNKLTDKSFQNHPNKVEIVRALKELILSENKRVQLLNIKQKGLPTLADTEIAKKKSRRVLMS